MTSCHCHCEVPRDGSGQLGRYLKALDPTYAPVDGRTIEDLLVFARRYAAQIRFYDVPGSKLPDDTPPERVSWQEFFRRDMAVIAASIAVVDTAQIKKDYDELRTALEAQPDRSTYVDLFNPILGMATRIGRWHAIAIAANPLHADLDLAIASTLRAQVDKIRALEEGFAFLDPAHPLALDYATLDTALWGLDKPVAADQSVYEGPDSGEKVRNAALYVDDVFHAFYGFMVRIVDVKSVGYMQFALESYPAHQPHMALFIAFLELFRLAQEQMNGLTARMLDFYYKDVLRLAAKPSIPDRAHVVFELAKDVVEYDVAAGTPLKAGKDAAGKTLTYATAEDLVVNQAKVKELKNIHVAKTLSADPAKVSIDGIFARPVADSVDGFGAPLPQTGGKWATFGKGVIESRAQTLCERIEAIGEDDDPRNDRAEIGFALASPQLVLQGGNRLIMWKVPGLPTELISAVYFTGEKGWVSVAALDAARDDETIKRILKSLQVFDPAIGVDAACYFASKGSIFIYLPVAESAVVPFDETLHAPPSYATSFPVLRVMIDPGKGFSNAQWTSSRLGKQALAVKVGSLDGKKQYFDGLKTLVLQNANGAVDGTKPFDPFTQYPQAGMPLYIGSGEIFNKPFDGRSELAVNIMKVTDGGPAHDPEKYSAYVLRRRQWVPLARKESDSVVNVFSRADLADNILLEQVKKDVEPAVLPRTPLIAEPDLTLESPKGFLRLDLVAARFEFSAAAPLADASALKVKEVSVSYVSVLAKFDPDIEQFFHIYPFGVTRVFLDSPDADLDASLDHLIVDAKQALLPQFTYFGPDTAYRLALEGTKSAPSLSAAGATSSSAAVTSTACEALIDKLLQEAGASNAGSTTGATQYSGDQQEEGILLIGLEGLHPLDTLSLLFEFAEGSAIDEDSDPPPIHWSYLVNNEWRPLKGENLISDDTYGFQTTGIVKIDVPRDITDNNTIVTTGLTWFAASVTEHSDRIPMLVSVVAQAAIAELRDNDNDPSHFDTALPAGTIAKLAVAVDEIASVAQPFASFDGKHREVGKEFYTRVSERLRHKARAITAWDYEHLVLDRFPSIYKVKACQLIDPNCLCRKVKADPKICCGPQIGPGHVLVVPIANLKHRNAVNPLQPKTSRRTLLEIQDYLSKRTSPFVHVRARNPVYEQILVFFQVQFTPGTNKGYFLKQLNDEIVHFLTPWAFDETAEVSFAQRVYASAIIKFIEGRPYVDFITDFLMFVCRDHCCPDKTAYTSTEIPLAEAMTKMKGCCDAERIFAGSAGHFVCDVIATPSSCRSILVSAPRHFIIPYETESKPSPCEVRLAAKQGPVVGPAPPANPATPPAPPGPPAPPEPVPGPTPVHKTATRRSGVESTPRKRRPPRKPA